MVCGLACVVQDFERLRVVDHAGQQHIVKAQNRVHGGTQLMADGRNELLAQSGGSKQFLAFVFELLVALQADAVGLTKEAVVQEGDGDHDEGHHRITGKRRHDLRGAHRGVFWQPTVPRRVRHDHFCRQHNQEPREAGAATDGVERDQRNGGQPRHTR